MAKYEIMLLISGKAPASEADALVEQLKTNIKSENLNVNYLGIKELAYEINKEKTAHYYLLNFDGEANSFFDFHRLALINKSVLRHLIVNLDKDYGARAIKNEKKVKIAKSKQTKYDEIIQNPDALKAPQRKAKYERPKKRDEWELVERFDLGNMHEHVSVKKPIENKPKPKVYKFEPQNVVQETKKTVVESQKPKVNLEHKIFTKPVNVEKPIVREKKIETHLEEPKNIETKPHNPKDVQFVKTPVSEVPDIHPKKVEKIKIHSESKSIDEVENKIVSNKIETKSTTKKPSVKKSLPKKSEKTVAKKTDKKKPVNKKTITKEAAKKSEVKKSAIKKPAKKVESTNSKKPAAKKLIKKPEPKKPAAKKSTASKKVSKK